MKHSTAQERFGRLARSFGVLLPAGRRYRRLLGLSLADQVVIEQLQYHYRQAGVWDSISQSVLAEELGISRATVNGHLQRLKRSGLVATRSDPRFGRPISTLRYCLDPYLAVLAMWESHDHVLLPDLWMEGNERLRRFAEAVDWGTWIWEMDGLRASSSPMPQVLAMFLNKYGDADKLSGPPTPIAVTVRQFLSEEQAPAKVGAKQRLEELLAGLQLRNHTDLSVPPTEVESHIYTSVHKELNTSIHKELKTLVVKELTTPRHEELKTSQLKIERSQLVTPTDERPETSADHQHGDLPVEEEVSDWLSEQ